MIGVQIHHRTEQEADYKQASHVLSLENDMTTHLVIRSRRFFFQLRFVTLTGVETVHATSPHSSQSYDVSHSNPPTKVGETSYHEAYLPLS